MLRFQIALAIVLVSCMAFVSCGRGQQMLDDPVTDDMDMMDMMDMMDTTDATDMMDMMDMMMEMAAHKSWAHVTLPEPVGTGTAHKNGSRTIYFNPAGAMANMTGGPYPAGTMIVKEAMDDTNTFIQQVVTMTKTDDPMYAAHNGWMYGAIERASETEELMMPHQFSVELAEGCHGCHVKASKLTDSVFVSLPAATMMDDTTMDDTTMDDTTMDDTTMDDTTMDDTTMDDTTMDDTTMDDTTMDDTTMDDTTGDNGAGNGDGNGAGNGNGDGNGDGNGNGAAQ